ncbi:hypothetical protein B296_00041919 [Ensete ventricosum]|uniref:Uncharacterized protein n=1 Tax=Ensete ventricosum TaxID=4639 RepID=A0A426XWF9_ENSVE|nr:hypothetical protein B296_00041919 [Ensete ventricosum]
MGQAEPQSQAVAGGLQVQTRLQTIRVAHKEHGSEQDEREVGYSPRAEEAPSRAPIEKKSYKERLITVETASMFLKRAWRNSTIVNEGSFG